MKKKDPDNLLSLCYVKVNDYLVNYLKMKYGEVIRFAYNTEAYFIMTNFIIKNPTFKELTPFCYSERMFNYDRTDENFNLDISSPSAEERDFFMPVEMPRVCNKLNVQFETSDLWQLNSTGTQKLRRYLMSEFYKDMINFIEECKTRSKLTGVVVTRENAIADFIHINSIDMKHYEKLLRTEQRYRRKYNEEIEARRNDLESKANKPFLYT